LFIGLAGLSICDISIIIQILSDGQIFFRNYTRIKKKKKKKEISVVFLGLYFIFALSR